MNTVWIGFDSREVLAFQVAATTVERNGDCEIHGVVLSELQARGLYWRPVEIRSPVVPGGRSVLWDVISDAPMATEFSCTRFLTPYLARMRGQVDGWAIFMDCDVLIRKPLQGLLALLDPCYAVMCVKHQHEPTADVKMRGELQTRYSRKNWSSVVAYNLAHPANDALTVGLVNTVPGRDLHAFCWLEDDQIGELPAAWNYLVGTTQADDPALVHFTDGLPNMPGHEHDEYAGEWRQVADQLKEG